MADISSASPYATPKPESLPLAFRMFRMGAGIMSALVPGLAARGLERVFTTPRRAEIPKRERQWLKGARPWHLELKDGRRIRLFEWGHGPTVLLVHGMAGRGSQMAAFAGPLAAAGFRVVTFDAPAHGASDGKRLALPDHAKVVAEIAAHLGPLAGLVAHSVGAAASAIALQRGALVDRVVLVSPPEDLQGYLRGLAEMLGFTVNIANRTQWRLERAHGLKFENARGRNVVTELRQPALIVHDHGDRVVPFAEGQTLAGFWPGADFRSTDGLGHNRILRDAQVVAQAVDFVSNAP